MRDDAAEPGARLRPRPFLASPAIEPVVFVGLALIFIWIIRPTDNDWITAPLLSILFIFPLASTYLHRDTRRELGLRVDNFGPSIREVGAFTIIAAALVAGAAPLIGTGPASQPNIWRSLLLYPAWGLAQQFAMQSFTYRRLRQTSRRPMTAAALTAILFASLHFPNMPLTILTLLAGYVWCRLFERHPNLITLALSHGLMAVLLRATWPSEWLHNLHIGPRYWTWTP